MYINDVIRNVKRLYPSEYDEEEMYLWCDEVSSMIAIEDRNVFKEIILKTDKNGSALLPEGVDIENVESVIIGDKILKKSDARNVFVKRNGCLCVKHGKHPEKFIRVVYHEPYYPIRFMKYRGTAVVSENGSCFSVGLNEFEVGDVISIELSNGAYKAEAVPLLGIEYTQSLQCNLKTTENDIPDGEYDDCIIKRHITDKTLCSAPYDSMYIDYILAKINMFQRDMHGYNHHMAAFNSRLMSYKKWLINHMPQEQGKLINWW